MKIRQKMVSITMGGALLSVLLGTLLVYIFVKNTLIESESKKLTSITGHLVNNASKRFIESHDKLTSFPEAFKQSWLYDELHQARNFKPWMSKGLKMGSLMFGIDQILFRGKALDDLVFAAVHCRRNEFCRQIAGEFFRLLEHGPDQGFIGFFTTGLGSPPHNSEYGFSHLISGGGLAIAVAGRGQ